MSFQDVASARSANWVRLLAAASLLLAITLISHMGIIANPGFFNHDEWQRLDHVQEHGYFDFALVYGRVYSGPEFGHPVRPLGFLQQGATSIWMERAPFLTHLFDVLLHSAVAIVVFLALWNIGAPLSLAWLAGLLFTLSPLTTLATGWMGASFDQWYVLFAYLMCWLIYRTAVEGLTPGRAVGLFAASTGAILSKETSLILPAVALIVVLAAFVRHGRTKIRPKAVAIGIAIVLIPLLAYMAIRFPALANSFEGRSIAPYTPSLANIARNLSYYFAYPFVVHTAEVAFMQWVAWPWIAGAILLHLSLVIGVWFRFGSAYAALYLAAYLAFLLPVLTLQQMGSHYLYGSSVVMAIALAALIHAAWRDHHRKAVMLGVLTSGILLVHSLWTQAAMYRDGICQTSFLSTLDTRIEMERQRYVTNILVVPDPGAPAHVAVRAIFGRDRYAGAKGVAVRFSRPDDQVGTADAAVMVRMTPTCQVR